MQTPEELALIRYRAEKPSKETEYMKWLSTNSVTAATARYINENKIKGDAISKTYRYSFPDSPATVRSEVSHNFYNAFNKLDEGKSLLDSIKVH